MKMSFIEAMARALYDAASEDENVLIIGTGFGGLSIAAREAFNPVYEKFADRVVAPPISELGIAGAALGAALAGSRPIVDLSTGSFVFQAFPQVVNEAPHVFYETGGQSRAPVVFCSLSGIRGGGAAQHSARPEAMIANVPGIHVMVPSAPSDVYAMLKWALLHSQTPISFLNHSLLFNETEEFDPDGAFPPFGQARIRRAGDDVTVIAHSIMVPRALRAAEQLAADGVSAEVVDLRTIRPLDVETLVASVRKTGRAVVVDESYRSFGVASEISAVLMEEAFHDLRTAVVRVATPDVPIPHSGVLENELVVSPERIARAVAGTGPFT